MIRFNSRFAIWLFATCLATFALLFGSAACFAEEREEPAASAPDSPAESEEKPVDPFAIPEPATNEELFAWMTKLARTPPPKELKIVDAAKKVFPAIIQACDIILDREHSETDDVKAIQQKFSAYSTLVRFDRSAREGFEDLQQRYASDLRPELAALANKYSLLDKGTSVSTMSMAELEAFGDEVFAYLDRFGATTATYATATSIASSISRSEFTETAATFHDKLGKVLSASSDERVQRTGRKLFGAARRIRLMGNPIELKGTLADGSEFQWSDYRGKVVLVDFWASWCGPCLAELPNMKKNLKLYGEKGFTIVGINMDSKREAFESCIEKKEISWVNIVSEEEGKTGWDVPMADYYGVSGIPTAILVNQEGNVVSLSARGANLDKHLAELLGKVEKEEKP